MKKNFRLLVACLLALLLVSCQEAEPTPSPTPLAIVDIQTPADFPTPPPTTTVPVGEPTATFAPLPTDTLMPTPSPTSVVERPTATLTPFPTPTAEAEPTEVVNEVEMVVVMFELSGLTTSRPIANAAIALTDPDVEFTTNTASDSEGNAQLSPMPLEDGDYLVEVSAENHASFSGSFSAEQLREPLVIQLEEIVTVAIIVNSLNVRVSPDLSAPILARAFQGDTFRMVENLADAAGNGWYRIQYDDANQGYISANPNFVSVTGELEEIFPPLESAVVVPATPVTPVVVPSTPTPQPTTPPVVVPSPTLISTPVETATIPALTEVPPTVAPQPTAVPPVVGGFAPTTLRDDMVNLRTTLDLMGGLLDRLNNGETATCGEYLGYHNSVSNAPSYQNVPTAWLDIYEGYRAVIDDVITSNEAIFILCTQGGETLSTFNYNLARGGIDDGVRRLIPLIDAANGRLDE